MAEALQQKIIPLFIEMIFPSAADGIFNTLETLFEPVCGLFDLLNVALSLVQGDIKPTLDAVKAVVDSIKDIAKSIKNIVNVRRLNELDADQQEMASSCTGHMDACLVNNSIDLDCPKDCFGKRALELSASDCASCHICYQPVSDVNGICVAVSEFASLEEGGSTDDLLQLHLTMVDRHLEKFDCK